MSTQARERRWRAAERYRPREVETLLVAEAPPSAEDRYFYFEDVDSHDSLFRYVARMTLGAEPTRENKAVLLRRLQATGVFLIDLQLDPRDSTALGTHVPDLIDRIKEIEPVRIVLIKASVYDAAYQPLSTAGLPVIDERIPFPGSGQQRRFEVAFDRALRHGPSEVD